jgi:S1-C subfamily serine protease
VGIEPVWDYSPALGELTLTVGFPASFFDPQFSTGFVTAASLATTMELFGRSVEWSLAFATDAATASGASGGPVFDHQGRWVGLHVGASTDPGLELSIQIPLRQ